jgi:hypothetical protein
MNRLDVANGLGSEDVKIEIVLSSPKAGLPSSGFAIASPSATGLVADGSNSVSGGAWISTDQAFATVSISKPSRSIRILPQESQLGGIRILSRSMTLCLMISLFRRDWMPRLEWMSVRTLLESKDVV